MILKEVPKGIRVVQSDVVELMERQKAFRNAEPRIGTLFLTYRCTSKCKVCSMWKRTIPKLKELDLEQWKGIADNLHENGVRVAELFGGDVFLRKDVLIPLTKHLKRLGMIVHMPTNSILMDGEAARGLVDAGIDCIYISADGVGTVHDNIRGVDGNFQRLVDTVKMLQKARGDKRLPTLFCNITISTMNVEHIEDIVSFADDMGFDVCALEYVGEFNTAHVEESLVSDVHPDPYFMKQGPSALLDARQSRELKAKVKKIKKAYKNSRMEIYTPNIDTLSCRNLHEGTVPDRKCHMERNEVTVDPYGNVIVCPFFSKYPLGNLLRDPLDLIWNNQKHLRFRQKQNSGQMEICRHCIMSVERSYGLRRGLERIFYKRIRAKLI